MFIFVKEGIRKLSDLNTVIGNNTRFILIGGICLQGQAQWSRNLSHKILENVECNPVRHLVAVSRVRYCATDRKELSATLSKRTSDSIRADTVRILLANPAHSGCSEQRTRGTNWQYQAHTSEMTVP